MAKNITLNPTGVTAYSNLAPPPVYPEDRKTINGHLFDSSSSPLRRTVVCVDQVLMSIVDVTVSDAGTGAFTLRPPVANKCAIFYLPNAGDYRNSVILSDLMPI